MGDRVRIPATLLAPASAAMGAAGGTSAAGRDVRRCATREWAKNLSVILVIRAAGRFRTVNGLTHPTSTERTARPSYSRRPTPYYIMCVWNAYPAARRRAPLPAPHPAVAESPQGRRAAVMAAKAVPRSPREAFFRSLVVEKVDVLRPPHPAKPGARVCWCPLEPLGSTPGSIEPIPLP